MGVIAAFVVGYVIGARQGQVGMDQTVSALRALAQSGLVRDLSRVAASLVAKRLGNQSWLLGLASDLAKDALLRMLTPRR
jgi:hypothetical protein